MNMKNVKIIISLSLVLSLCPMVKKYKINKGILTVHHNDVVDIKPTTSKSYFYNYGSENVIVSNGISFTNVIDYSVE